MPNKESWKTLTALLMVTVLLVLAPVVSVMVEEPKKASEEEIIAAAGEDASADENGFVIVDGVLQKYLGEGGDVVIPEEVTSIGNSAFNGCKKLKSITIQSTKLKTVGKNAFKGIKATAKIKVPKAKLKAYKKLLKGKGQGSKVKITK